MKHHHLPSSPGEVVAALPALLGHPIEADSAVLIGLSRARPGYALALATELDPEGPADLAEVLLAAAVADGAEAVAVFVYAADAYEHGSPAEQLAAAVALRASDHNLRVLDAVRVVGDRWASYLCPEPSCCPPDGSLIPTPKEPHS